MRDGPHMTGHPWTALGWAVRAVTGLVAAVAAVACLAACVASDDGQPSPSEVRASPTPQPLPAATVPAVTRPGATTPEPGIQPSDCLVYSAASLKSVRVGDRGWLLTDGSHQIVLLDNADDAGKALALAQRHTAHCFIGRDNPRPNRDDYIIGYWKPIPGVPATFADEDCVPYRTASLRIVDEGASGWLLTDGLSRMNMLDNRQDASNALILAQQFSKQCFIGRNNNRPDRTAYVVQYWQ
jgi:hypothetical protein